MQKNQVDQTLAFKKRARRRLVGAIALVFLMVIVLPMILKDREQDIAQEEEIDIIMPSQELAIADDEEALVLPEKTTDSSTVTEVVNETPIKETVIDSPTVESLPKPEPKPTTKPVEVAKPKPEEKPVVKPTEVKKTNNTAGKSNQFYVQIGVFSEMANVKKLQSRLSDLGYQSVTEDVKTDKGVKTRLRTETFDGRNEAAIALENIKDSGLTGMVVSQK